MGGRIRKANRKNVDMEAILAAMELSTFIPLNSPAHGETFFYCCGHLGWLQTDTRSYKLDTLTVNIIFEVKLRSLLIDGLYCSNMSAPTNYREAKNRG